MTTTTFKIANNTSNFRNNNFNTTDYSKILDNIIAANIINTNPYLKKTKDPEDIITTLLNDSKKKHGFKSFGINNTLAEAANFIANYSKHKEAYYKIPFAIGKTYKLIDGTPFCFYDDEIQIGMDLFKYDDLDSLPFLYKLEEPTKKIIINIFNANKSNIKISII